MTAWNKAPERGAGWLVTLMMWLLRHVAWFASGVVLPGISVWFFLSSPKARAASRDFLGTALGRPARARDVLRHIHVFACAILDRTLMLIGPPSTVSLEVNGLDLIEATVADGRGCVLLGAHLGSFAVLRQLAERAPVPVRMLMHRDNAGAFTRAMEALDPALRRDVIQVGDVRSMLRAHEAVASGAIVGVLADRAPAGARQITVPFFGRPAGFPAGPFVLTASLGAPVLLFSAVRIGHRRYAVTFERFADKVILRRATRQADLLAAVTRYAAWLETACRAHPFNWFNFYPFWERAPHAPTQARPHGKQMAAASRNPVVSKSLGPTSRAAAG